MKKPTTTSQILKKRARKQQRGPWLRILKWSLWSVLLLMVLAVAGTVGVFWYIGRDLPKISSLQDYDPPIITTVHADDGNVIAEFFRERRIVLPLAQIPLTLQQAFIAAEDARFYKHKGIDLISIIRAMYKNLEAGTIVQGGSTITQQVTKSFLLTPERSYERKIKEAILAYQIDRSFSKDEILFLYLNQIYLGHGAYGVEAAAQNYFGKSVDTLNLAECAMLAGLPQAPSRYSPFRHPDRAKQRQIYVLNRMVEEGYIDQIEASEAIETVLDIHPRRNLYLEQVPVYSEHVRRYLEQRYGMDALYSQGLKVHTAVNIDFQQAAMAEIEKGLKDLDRREGYRGPLKQLAAEEIDAFLAVQAETLVANPLEPGRTARGVVVEVDDRAGRVRVDLGGEQGVMLLDDMRWARKPNPDVHHSAARLTRPSQALASGDVILVALGDRDPDSGRWQLQLDQTPRVQAALMCIEADTGLVKAMMGGRDFSESQFNRAIQSRRQPGSAFKPIIYAAALDHGYTAASVIIDSPIVFQDPEQDFTWKPKNYGERFYGPTLFRDALAHSRNVVTIKILQDIGIDYAIDYARKMGIESNLNRDLSIALGSSGVSLLELVRAYTVFANQGHLVEPAFITKIEDRHGNLLEEMNPERRKVIEASTAYIMTNLLEGVVKYGTGQRMRALKRPVAGKTGTTNNLFDAWFVGYTPRYVTGVWVGYDQEQTLGRGETGAGAAGPIWFGFMDKILQNEPVRIFPVPEGVVFAKIDADTGLLPIPESKNTVFEVFKEDSAPVEYTPRPGTVTEPEQFFKQDL
ncbi:penicillin-binding protein 1A [Desulfatitalea alkaliphila]|uniref:Penicillin-binding protein 1A n=1 Tax=Desulfatitalea alkaliphila TaxID=2929485 RepID=A0AA41QY68_9BACT|nr:penicillin-binding protein 1A [Desulfatitalea alkaliphila]MCJ8499142.1 penicillin-binding protein 1A [Desulfatitalea alkaliphila]